MPMYEYRCPENHSQDVYFHNHRLKEAAIVTCNECSAEMRSIISFGRGLLYFEEGRGRWIYNLGDKPVFITSRKQHQAEMKKAGVCEAGDRIGQKGCW